MFTLDVVSTYLDVLVIIARLAVERDFAVKM